MLLPEMSMNQKDSGNCAHTPAVGKWQGSFLGPGQFAGKAMPWQIEIGRDKLRVGLDLRRRGSNETIEASAVIEALRAKQIPVNAPVERLVAEVLARCGRPGQGESQPTLLEGRPAQNGQDGCFEWSEHFDPGKRKEALEQQEKSGRCSHYTRGSLILAAKGDVLGVRHAATAGEPGEDVFGKPIPAVAGKECRVEPGKNAALDADGQTFRATCDGQPRLQGAVLGVDSNVTVKADVDFGTGNIRYSGSLSIKGDIKDMFEVQAGGDVEVGGTIEAARVVSGGNLIVRRGVAGKGKGFLSVGGELTAKYLSNVSAWVRRHVRVGTEIVNGEINCRGQVVLESGAIHGGQVTAGRTITAAVLGSPSGVRTVIRAGLDPFRERAVQTAEQRRDEQESRLSALLSRAKALLAAGGGQHRDDLRQLAEEIKAGKKRLEKLQRQEIALRAKLARSQERIVVQKMIHPGVVLHIGETVHLVHHPVTGPLEAVVRREEGQPETLEFRAPGKGASVHQVH